MNMIVFKNLLYKPNCYIKIRLCEIFSHSGTPDLLHQNAFPLENFVSIGLKKGSSPVLHYARKHKLAFLRLNTEMIAPLHC